MAIKQNILGCIFSQECILHIYYSVSKGFIMGKSPCSDAKGLKKGPWTPEEDQKLVDYINKNDHRNWKKLSKLAGLNRCGKSCRLRWKNYLRPDIKRGKFSEEDEQLIIHLHSVHGNKWSRIATHLEGRTDNQIKNHWNTRLKKKLLERGIDPITHLPITDHTLFGNQLQLLAAANFSNLMNLQAHVAQLSRAQLLQNLLQIRSLGITGNASEILNQQGSAPLHDYPFHQQYNPSSDPFEGVGDVHAHAIVPPVRDPTDTSGDSSSQILNFYRLLAYENATTTPSLVSASPERSIVNESESNMANISNIISTNSSISTTFEENLGDNTWEHLMD